MQGQKAFSFDVNVAEAGSEPTWIAKDHQLVEQVRAEQLPQPLSGWTVSAYNRGSNFAIEGAPDNDAANRNVKSIYFLSSDAQIDSQQEQKLVKEGDSWVLELPRNEEYEGDPKKHLPG